MKKLFFFAIALLFVLSSFISFEKQSTTNATLNSVTVYRSGASLEHTASASLAAGDNELTVEGLSSYLDINSIQVNCPAAVTIMGLEFNNNYLGEENISPAVKKMKDTVQSIKLAIQKIDIEINTSKELLDVLRVNKEIKGAQTGMSTLELSKLMTYYKDKSLEVQTDLLNLNLKRTELNDRNSKMQQQIAEEQKKNTSSGGRLILQLQVAVGGSYKFDISYLSQNAYWTPYYDIRSDNIKSPLTFVYKAKISQTTGIDWKKVKLSLSTSSPRQYSNAPLFKTWFLSYINPVRAMDKDLSKMNSIPAALQGRVSGIQIGEAETIAYGTLKLRGSSSMTAYGNPIYVVNGALMSPNEFSKISPAAIKSTDVLKGNAATSIYGPEASNGAVVVTLKDGLEDYVTVSDTELDVSYDIDLPYDVPTNGKQQVATLKETKIPASYKYYTVPKLTKEAFLLAEVANWQTLNLLPGEANIIFEGTYIGKSFIDPANTSDTLNLTMGTDKRVVVTREKLTDYSSVRFLGSNTLQTITYEITVKNNKKEPINIIVKDQYPISTNKEIEVKLENSSNASVNEEIGVLTWQMTIEPGKSEKRRISYSAKYPKNKTINFY